MEGAHHRAMSHVRVAPGDDTGSWWMHGAGAKCSEPGSSPPPHPIPILREKGAHLTSYAWAWNQLQGKHQRTWKEETPRKAESRMSAPWGQGATLGLQGLLFPPLGAHGQARGRLRSCLAAATESQQHGRHRDRPKRPFPPTASSQVLKCCKGSQAEQEQQ